MQYMARFLILCLAITLTTTAYDGIIYTFDSGKGSTLSHNGVVREDVAKLVLEQRMKPTRSTSLGTVEEEVVELLNHIGGQQVPLFGDEAFLDRRQRLLIVCEGVGHESVSAVTKAHKNSITIRQIPSNFIDGDFFKDILDFDPATSGDSRACVFEFKKEEAESRGSTLNLLETRECLSRYSLFGGVAGILSSDSLANFSHISVDSWVGKKGTAGILKLDFEANHADPLSTAKLLDSLSENFSASTSELDQEVTVLILPLRPSHTASNRQRRSDWREALLSKSSNPLLSDASIVPKSQQSKTTPSTLMPVCHASNSSCVTATNNCSGHGYCYLKYASKDEAIASDCYACKCEKTVMQNPDGTVKTVQWGGATCHKEDVSTPFFLLAGITILAVVAISSGIRMLFGVGQEELPSVIGAGVGISRTQR